MHKFKVTDLGLVVDKVMVMPGSELVVSVKPPAHWDQFGTYSQAAPKEMTVATPKKKKGEK